MAMRVPSGDHVGAPGWGSVSCIFVTVPVATSTTDICATRHMPSTLKNAMRFPSGDHAGALRLRGQVGERRRLAPSVMSRIQSCRCALPLSDE